MSTHLHTRLSKPYHPYISRIMWTGFCILLAYFYIIAMQQYSDKLYLPLEGTTPSSNLLFTLTQIGLSEGFSRTILISWTWLVILIGYITSAFIIWKRNDDWVAIGTAIGLLYVGRIALNFNYNGSAADYIPAVMSAIYISILLVFPDGQLNPRWSVYIPVWGLIAEMPLELYFGGEAGKLPGAFEFIRTAYPIPLILVLIYRHRRILVKEAKQQSKWLFILIFVLALGQLLYSIPEIIPSLKEVDEGYILRGVGETFYYVGATAAPVAIVFAILRYRLWDIDLFINRTIVYSIIAMLVLTMFFAIATALQMGPGNTSPLIALVISVLLTIGFFRPVRNQTQHLVDRYIYGLRFDLNELERFQTAVTIKNPGSFSGFRIGEYEVRGLIGKGGMGEVYEGFGTGKRVAIKTLRPEIVRDDEARTRFEREIEAGQRLQHPNITPIIDSGEHNGALYMVMEYIDGQDLGNLLKGGGILTVEASCRIIGDLCQALSAAHEAGYVHRDIKPANIILRENGQAMLMDFGISKFQEANSITGTNAIGTIHYMAPEQIQSSKDVDHRADIYGIGCVLFELLTGRHLFDGTASQVMFAQINKPPPDPTDYNPHIPDAVAFATLKALEKNPANRFVSAIEFAEVLMNSK